MDEPTADDVFKRIRQDLADDTATGPDGRAYPAGTDTEPRQKCRRCGEYKPVSEYGFHHGVGSARRKDCRLCQSARQQERRLNTEAGTHTVVPLTERQKARVERQTEVERLFGQGFSYKEIGEKLGYSHHTVQDDVIALGLTRSNKLTQSKSIVKLVDNVTEQLDALAGLVHDGRHVVIDLDGVDIPWETKAEWKKRLSHLGRAMRYIRKYTEQGRES